jgi:hypothetical protein
VTLGPYAAVRVIGSSSNGDSLSAAAFTEKADEVTLGVSREEPLIVETRF